MNSPAMEVDCSTAQGASIISLVVRIYPVGSRGAHERLVFPRVMHRTPHLLESGPLFLRCDHANRTGTFRMQSAKPSLPRGSHARPASCVRHHPCSPQQPYESQPHNGARHGPACGCAQEEQHIIASRQRYVRPRDRDPSNTAGWYPPAGIGDPAPEKQPLHRARKRAANSHRHGGHNPRLHNRPKSHIPALGIRNRDAPAQHNEAHD
jgi:hypothetical protein